MSKIRMSKLTSPSELTDYSREHLTYEIKMLMFLANSPTLKQVNEDDNQYSKRMAHVESFVLHLRNLIDFFEPLSPRNDDVIVTDFLPFQTKISSPTEKLEKARIRANKELAHLTADRQSGSPETKEWASDLLNDLSILLSEFIDKADNNYLASKTIDIIKQFIKDYPPMSLTKKTDATKNEGINSIVIGWTGPRQRDIE